MAVYKLFPYKDATIYSYYPLLNSGMDTISEVYNVTTTEGTPDIARFLTQFSTEEIQDTIDNKINGNLWDVSLKGFIASAQGISTDYIIEVWPVAQTWNNGTGEFGDSPLTTDGISWSYPLYSGSISWSESGNIGTELYTSSYSSTYATQGGGNWFYSGSGIDSYGVTQSFDLRSDKDLNIGVKTIVSQWYSGSIPNYGFITKFTSSVEFDPSIYVQPILKYYSVDTNTIYPPQLEFKWRDYSTVLTGSLANKIVTTPTIKLSLDQNPQEFYPDSVNRFRLNVSPLYPTRAFQTTTLFTNLNYLPTSSYYAIKDLDTNEYIIMFDEQYTQISSDSNGNYFDVYMNGLEPERYYKVLIKTIINGSTLILDNDYYFKIIN